MKSKRGNTALNYVVIIIIIILTVIAFLLALKSRAGILKAP